MLLIAACAGDRGIDPAASPDAATSATAAAAPADLAAAGVRGHDFVPGELIARLATPIDGTAPVFLGGQRLTPIRRLPSGSWHFRIDDVQRRGPAAADLAAVTVETLDAVRADPAVEWAHENAIAELSFTPNDPLYSRQWQWAPSLVPQAWDRITGINSVRLALIDTGSNDHPDLAGHWLQGYDFVANDDDPTDTGTYPHGVHVAGIAGAATHNGIGVAGICSGCRMIMLRVSPTTDQIERAIYWVAGVDTNPATNIIFDSGVRRAEVINMSFNIPDVTSCDAFPDIRDAIALATARGVSLVASAGNQHHANGPRWPAVCPGTLAVGASTATNTLASYSNRGTGIDLLAPAGEVFNGDLNFGYYGEGVGCPPPTPGANDQFLGTGGAFSTWTRLGVHCYRHLAGTSMAAPHVVGIIGLMRSVRPTIAPAEVERILAATAQAGVVPCVPESACGAGLVNAAAAVRAVEYGPGAEIVVPGSVAFGAVAVGGSASQTVTISNIAGSNPNGTGILFFNASIAGGFSLSCGGACSGVVLPGGTRNLTVTFAPAATGPHNGVLTLLTNDSDEARLELPLSGSGGVPVASVTPATLSFGSVTVGAQSLPQNITLSNSGSVALTYSAESNNANFLLSCAGGCSGSLPPAQSRSLTVTYRPLSAGSHSGLITVSSSDPLHPTLNVAMTGTGLAAVPAIAVSPPTINFGYLLVGTPTTQQLTVSNPGTAPLVLSSASVPAGFTVGGTYPITVAASGSTSIPVTCPRATAGGWGGDLVLTHNAGAPVHVGLSCASAAGRLVTEVPASGEFLIADGDSTTVRVRNTGPLDVTVEHLGFGGDPNSWFTVSGVTLPAVIPVGGTLSWTVTCHAPAEPSARRHWEKHFLKDNAIDDGSIAAGCHL